MRTKAVRRARVVLACLSLVLAGSAVVGAAEFRTPSVSAIRVDWRAALDQVRSELSVEPAVASSFTFSPQRRFAAFDARSRPALVQLNAVTSQMFRAVARSPVPVLLPFDAAAFLDARLQGARPSLELSRYQAGFRAVDLFEAGPAGYDAVFSLEPGATDLPRRIFATPIEVQITGSSLIYDINDPLGGRGEPVKALATQYPDLRRFIREGHVRYAFTRFGVPYVVSIQCLDSAPHPQRLACREAYPVAEHFIRALRVCGGSPSRPAPNIQPALAERAAEPSAIFTYRPSGDIVINSGFRKQVGHADLTVYSQIRFPLEKAPAFAHSQSFRNFRPRARRLDEPTNGGPGYPWQDNFCESRSFGVGQCANGFGHQGQDIRPRSCPQNPVGVGGERCDPKQHAVVAVRDGIVIRSARQQALTLQINTRTEHIRFRYMHMNPFAMDASGILNGRSVGEGEIIGVVSNYLDGPNGTSRHLHFDVQVFTPDGWLWVNPYVTLISAYERLIGGRGREIGPEASPLPTVANASPDDVLGNAPRQARQR